MGRHGSNARRTSLGVTTVAGLVLVILGAMGGVCCDYDHEAISDKSRVIRLVPDTQEVRLLLASGERLGLANKRNDAKLSEQTAFVDAMTSRATIEIPPGTYFRVLEWSNAVCSTRPQENPAYIKVLITTGSAKGEIGWACLGDVTLTNTPL
jgi:hypothetical protein